jgi:hypothetical protein
VTRRFAARVKGAMQVGFNLSRFTFLFSRVKP